MKIIRGLEEKKFKTPFHAYQFANVRNFEFILEDIESDKLVSDIGETFDVTFPIEDMEEPSLSLNRERSSFDNDLPF